MNEINSPGLEALRTFRRRLTKWTIISAILVAAVFGLMQIADTHLAEISAARPEIRA